MANYTDDELYVWRQENIFRLNNHHNSDSLNHYGEVVFQHMHALTDSWWNRIETVPCVRQLPILLSMEIRQCGCVAWWLHGHKLMALSQYLILYHSISHQTLETDQIVNLAVNKYESIFCFCVAYFMPQTFSETHFFVIYGCKMSLWPWHHVENSSSWN